QEKWLAANPKAAKLGKAMLKSLGGQEVTAYGTDAFVGQLLKRMDLVERKISGVKKGRPGAKGKGREGKDETVKHAWGDAKSKPRERKPGEASNKTVVAKKAGRKKGQTVMKKTAV
ncbi:MAG: hypothetical protein ABUL46_01100, partial [Chitinophaga rupis]